MAGFARTRDRQLFFVPAGPVNHAFHRHGAGGDDEKAGRMVARLGPGTD
jgi:hypothetical protein